MRGKARTVSSLTCAGAHVDCHVRSTRREVARVPSISRATARYLRLSGGGTGGGGVDAARLFVEVETANDAIRSLRNAYRGGASEAMPVFPKYGSRFG